MYSIGLMALDELHKKVLKTSKSRQDVSEWVLKTYLVKIINNYFKMISILDITQLHLSS